MSKKMQKDQAHKLVDKMADNSTWDDLMNEIYVPTRVLQTANKAELWTLLM